MTLFWLWAGFESLFPSSCDCVCVCARVCVCVCVSVRVCVCMCVATGPDRLLSDRGHLLPGASGWRAWSMSFYTRTRRLAYAHFISHTGSIFLYTQIQIEKAVSSEFFFVVVFFFCSCMFCQRERRELYRTLLQEMKRNREAELWKKTTDSRGQRHDIFASSVCPSNYCELNISGTPWGTFNCDTILFATVSKEITPFFTLVLCQSSRFWYHHNLNLCMHMTVLK